MPEFGGRDFEQQDASVDAVHRADSFLDALAEGRPVAPADSADVELAALLGGWRDELRWPPATGLIAESDAIAALNAGLAEKRPSAVRDRWTDTQKRGSRRGLSIVGTAAAAALCLGGFGAVVAGSGPGDGLYGVRTMLFGQQKQVRDAQVGLAAQTELNQVQDLIDQGDWDQAQNKLVAVSTQVATIGDEQQKQQLLDQFNDLSAKVVGRDPEATAPPGVVYTVPPSAAALVPAVGPTSVPSAPALSSTVPPQPVTASSTTPTTASPTPATTSATVSPSAPVSSAEPTSAAETPVSSVEPSSETPSSVAQPTTPAAPASAAQDTAATTAEPRQEVGTTAGSPTAEAPPPTQSPADQVPQPTTAVPSVAEVVPSVAATTPVLVPAG